jgi:hypothetical protein
MRSHLLVVTLAVVTVLLESPAAAQDSLEAASPRREARTIVATSERFQFNSDPWINLHHFLYQWAREDAGIATGRRKVVVPERSSLDGLSSEERSAWLSSVGFYRDHVASKGLFDDEMLQQKEELLMLAGDPLARPPDRITGIAAALRTAMPIYQDRWWPHHDKENRGWIARVLTPLRACDGQFVEMTVRVYGAVWPKEPWRVDVSAYANFAAGYTTYEGRVVVYSTDAGNQGLYALETIFHEIQHAGTIAGSNPAAIARAFKAAGAEVPANLWHALIFATAGEFVRSTAASERQPDYIPYWIKQGFESLDGWSTLVPAVRQHWLPVVRGETSREAGLAALARALRPQP